MRTCDITFDIDKEHISFPVFPVVRFVDVCKVDKDSSVGSRASSVSLHAIKVIVNKVSINSLFIVFPLFLW